MVIIYDYLVGGWALPLLKNNGANRQLGWWHSQLFMEKKTSSKPQSVFFCADRLFGLMSCEHISQFAVN
jgi:hypothetical protein